MIRSPFLRDTAKRLALAILLLLPAYFANAQAIGHVEVLSVSPRDVEASPSDVFDEVASGLNVVGIEEKVYLEAVPAHGATLGGATWALTGKPSGSGAVLSDTSGTLITLVPDVPGTYIVQLTPLNNLQQPTQAVEQLIYAGQWVGAGVFNSNGTPDSTIPHCGNSCCHSESEQPRLNIVDQWIGTNHANKLQLHLGGQRGANYEVSCLPCHTVGFKDSAMNGGFDDIAAAINYDLNQIPALVAQAANQQVDNWPQLPAALQSHASIQCESCHGPGSNHLGNILETGHGIGGVDLSPKQCAQCHDSSRPEGQGFYQWSSSSHPVTAELSEGHVAESDTCRLCHTGEGFVYGRVEGLPIPQLPTEEYHGTTCSTCHDPHGSPNEHQLRVVSNFTIPSGVTVQNPENSGACVRCHNSRIANGETTSQTSTRGAHYGTQTDIYVGSTAADFGLPFIGNSAHTTIVDGMCVTCHMAETPEGEPGVGGHSYAIRDTRGTATQDDDFVNAHNACGACHAELSTSVDRTARGDYDGDGAVEGIQSEVKGLLTVLRTRILATMAGTSVNASTGKIDITTPGFNALSPDQKRALYNYNLIWLDGSYGVHNTSYSVQVLQRSYFGAFGHTITDDYPNIDLRGPVQASTVPTPTPSPTPVPTSTPVPTPVPEYLAEVEIRGVSPREVAEDQSGILDESASGLRTVGVGEKVYLDAVKKDATVISYSWSIFSKPAGSTATLSSDTGPMVTFRPDVKGTYIIRLTPQVSTKAIIDVYDLRLYAAEWAGVGTLSTQGTPHPVAPQCGTSFCHGGNNANADLNILSDWLKSNHATKLQSHMNGQRGPDYEISCLPCHTVGFNDHMQAVNKGFDDIAASLPYDLNQIPALVADAANNSHTNFPLLPGELQNHSSIQCESCHGAGSLHPANLTSIDKGMDGKNLDTKQCARCHDSTRPEGAGFYQWSNSTHPVTAELSEGHVAESDTCRLCHTGEGFIAGRVDNKPIPQLPTEEYHGITCSVCHDPHYSNKPHQLRVSGDFTIPSGARPYGAGTGGTCFRCHNSRVANAETTALTSFRGAHYGPQSDMLLGSSGAAFSLAFNPSSPHGVVVENSCTHCHMAESPAGEPGATSPLQVGGHSYSMRDDNETPDTSDDITNVANACQQCHLTLNTYDYASQGDYDGDGAVEGTQTEVSGLFDLLRPGILAWTGTSVNAIGAIDITSGGFSALTPDQKRALYNYNFVWKDGSRGVHNTSYAVQLLQRSYFGVYGKPITDDFPNIFLRGPVQSGGPTPTPTPTPSPSPTATASPTTSPTVSATASPTPTASISPTTSPSPTSGPSPTASATPSATATPEPSPTDSPTATPVDKTGWILNTAGNSPN